MAALSPSEVAERLAAPPRERAAFLREMAEAGHAEAQAVYAQMLLDGVVVPADRCAACRLFRSAAAQHHLMALNMVGRCYELGWGVPVNMDRAAECFRIAAERGLVEAMYNYATRLTLGEGVPLDRAAALDWLEKAAALGYVKAFNFVGSFAEDGWACERDLERAAAYYARAAEGGDFRGAFNHARMLVGASRISEAVEWFGQSMAMGTPAFREKVLLWLRRSGIAELQELTAEF
jgi:TPR repeat protein